MILSDLTSSVLNKLNAISNSILTKLDTIENKITSSSSSSGSSVIRKITRGTSSVNGSVTINCSITDINKTIVLLNSDITYGYYSDLGAAGASVYLKSISNSNIVVAGKGVTITGTNGG